MTTALLPPRPRRAAAAATGDDERPERRHRPPSRDVERRPALAATAPAYTLRRILLVDDDPFMRHMLPRRLQRVFGDVVVVDTAATPDEALRLLDASDLSPFLVLSDYDLRTTLTGIDLLRRVAEARPDAIRILFSGHSRHEIGDGLEHDSIDGFVEKPFRLDAMFPHLLDIIERLPRDGRLPRP